MAWLPFLLACLKEQVPELLYQNQGIAWSSAAGQSIPGIIVADLHYTQRQKKASFLVLGTCGGRRQYVSQMQMMEERFRWNVFGEE